MKEVPAECRGYARLPTVSGDNIVFVAEDDLWAVERAGGRPRRLTNLRGAYDPLLRPGGDEVAFSVGSDVWTLSLRDTRPRRLTWFGDGTARAVAWTPPLEGLGLAVVVASTCEDPHGRPLLYRVPAGGGQPQLLYHGEYDSLAHQPNGRGVCLGRHTFDPLRSSRWKGYRGGKHGAIWLDRTGAGSFERLVLRDKDRDSSEEHELNVSCLMWLADRIWFVADPDGSGNLWSVDLKGQDLKKQTDHSFFDVRGAQGSGETVVYACGGDLWVLQVGGRSEKLELDFGAPLSHLPQFVDAADACESVLLHPDGHHVACSCRGQAFEMPLWEGPALPMCDVGEGGQAGAGTSVGRTARCVAMVYLYSGRLVTITTDGTPLHNFTIHPEANMADEARPTRAQQWISLLVSDAGLGGQRVAPDRPFGDIFEVAASPAHDALLLCTGRNELLLAEFVPEVGERPNPQKEPTSRTDLPLRLETKLLDRSEWEEGLQGPCWSSDGEWAAYVRKDSAQGSSIVLYCMETGAKTVVADSSFANFGPCFDASGRFLSFLSSRIFAPLEDDVTADLCFASGSELPYLVLLQNDAMNPFHRPALSPAEMKDREDDGAAGPPGDEEEPEGDGDEAEGGEDQFQPPEKIRVDLDGISERICQFPLPFGKYHTGDWTESGKFVYLRGTSLARQPDLDGEEDAEDTPGMLFAYNFSRLKEEKLAEHVQDVELSMDLRNMLVCTREPGPDTEDEYRVHIAGEKLPGSGADGEDEDADLDNPGPESGLLDLGARISLEVVPAQEWAQIFEETCKHVRENYLDDKLGGVDWDDTCAQYRALLPRLRSRTDLTDVLSELLCELGISHTSVADPPSEYGGEGSPLLGSHGHLGVQASWQELEGAGAYRIDSVTKGDIWDMRYSGPLARAGVGLVEGSFIIAVNRVRVLKEVSLEQMLANFSGCEVLLTVVPPACAQRFAQVQGMLHKSGGMDGFRRLSASQLKAFQGQSAQDGKKAQKKKKGKKAKKGGGEGTQAEAEKKLAAMLSGIGVDVNEGPIWRTVRVRAADAQTRRNAVLRDLVERRLRRVHEATSGRVGYVHVPDTCEMGFAEFHRYFGQECARDALVVDLRCNSGGFATELILKHLRNIPIGYEVARPGRGKVQVCPRVAVQGPVVLLIDENTSSDGETWAEAFQRHGLGKVVGVRTWGGVCAVGGADLDLIDGGSVSIPYLHWFVPGKGFGLENRGAEPDVVVEWPPAPVGAACQEDPQLAEAIRQAESLLAARPGPPEIPAAFPRTRLHRRRQVAAP